jgi:hypothetical protein
MCTVINNMFRSQVKPSNVVKTGNSAKADFCVVDFGLSRSIVVPNDSSLADIEHYWSGQHWMRPTTTTTTPPPPTTTTTTIATNQLSTLTSQESSPQTTTPNTTTTTINPEACYRKERAVADFRGTSMYASVRVHQLKDYCPRDDMWSLLYVFCDLVSGGLPWMSHAANRDRSSCQKLKERIHGLEAQADGEIVVDTARLLMGDEYHVQLFRKYRGGIDPPVGSVDDIDDPALPPPLSISKDQRKVHLLTTAFEHLKGLQFCDRPDYNLIRQCLEGFLTEDSSSSNNSVRNDSLSSSSNTNGKQSDPDNVYDGTNMELITCIDWQEMSDSFHLKYHQPDTTPTTIATYLEYDVPIWDLADADERDPVDSTMLAMAEASEGNNNSSSGGGGASSGMNGEDDGPPLVGEAADMARLPLEVRFRVKQMMYNTLHHTTIESHLALRDWMKVALFLLYGHWDAKTYEKGGHRTDDDGYRQELYLKLIGYCLDCSTRFRGFHSKECFYEPDNKAATTATTTPTTQSPDTTEPGPLWKKRKIITTFRAAPKNGSSKGAVDMIGVSKVMYQLRRMKTVQEKLPRAPPPRLSFG